MVPEVRVGGKKPVSKDVFCGADKWQPHRWPIQYTFVERSYARRRITISYCIVAPQHDHRSANDTEVIKGLRFFDTW